MGHKFAVFIFRICWIWLFVATVVQNLFCCIQHSQCGRSGLRVRFTSISGTRFAQMSPLVANHFYVSKMFIRLLQNCTDINTIDRSDGCFVEWGQKPCCIVLDVCIHFTQQIKKTSYMVQYKNANMAYYFWVFAKINKYETFGKISKQKRWIISVL